MITFIALAIALVALAMAFVLLPLLRNRAGGDIDRAQRLAAICQRRYQHRDSCNAGAATLAGTN